MNKQSLSKAVMFAIVLLIPVAAHASSASWGIGSGRLLPTTAGILGLIGVIVGRRAFSASRIGGGRTGAMVSTLLGLVSALTGSVHAATSAGGFGTGNGLAGAMVAMVLGLVSMTFGGLALARSRRLPKRSNE